MSPEQKIRLLKTGITCWCIMLSVCPQTLFGQLPGYEQRNAASIHLPGTIFLNELLKDTYTQKTYPDVKGSPFYTDAWKNASILFIDGKQYNDVKVKVNLYTHEFVCLSASNAEIILKDGIVNRLVLQDTNESHRTSIHVFAAAIPFIEKDTTYPILEVLTEGKAILFNMMKRKIINSGDVLSVGEQKEFASSEALYLFHEGQLKKCGKNAESYAKLFSDKKEKIGEFIKISKIKCRSPQEVILLVNYYNSL